MSDPLPPHQVRQVVVMTVYITLFVGFHAGAVVVILWRIFAA